MEDLWAFNDEQVAYAIYESRIPVISAVGHEPDVTISDYVADLRAATPSNAAELAVQDQEALRQTLDAMSCAMATALTRQLKASRKHLQVLAESQCLISPMGYLRQRREGLQNMNTRLLSAQNRSLSLRKQRFVGLTAKLDAMSPLKVLSRGYAMAQTDDGQLLRSVNQIHPGENAEIILGDGVLTTQILEVRKSEYES